jgi:hypothetical protein
MIDNAATRVAGAITEDSIAERRLWVAVLTSAIEDWRNGTLRHRREAQQFLFENCQDFASVCASAGVDANGFRTALLRIGKKIAMKGPWHDKMAA